ncbi:uncharacterized protein BO88DRAFT_450056 [Aspergillus vadensis CBS 113365]|uniref:Xaa-Pro dipeptidyl-peptidase-like domain-containing protein n=1 Tax=Aspergillus vadensis (strain CBS 113365 / IMI 142717 / IBT 24658) TaxID=1448311 RepID=A0A319BNE0_ASPVC|nr:hypothetical protein BO88DRAFT_450056 [Aspergillus vadensis CBS 113365]PYH72660.1 hypothetical protein BO88DRAFT_450056 [Aspergillus vadensis CBS 113365]
MPNQYRNIQTTDSTSFPYIYEQNVSVPLGNRGVVRCNVYKSKAAAAESRFPVLVTYGPYGEDVPYEKYVKSQKLLRNEPDASNATLCVGTPPLYFGQAIALIDGFCDVIDYYAATEWQVAARQPPGIAAIVPWEGFSDAYNESLRHGGILSNKFFDMWYARQVASNQNGLPGAIIAQLGTRYR